MKTIIQCKNKYNYTIKQLFIDYNKKTYKIGYFKIGADKTTTRKDFNKIINHLILIGFKEIK